MPIMYKTLNIYIRKYGQNPSVEAFGPNGEWAEECTEMPSEEDSQVLSQSLRVPGSLEELGDRLGRALMPGSVLQLYTEVLQRTLAYPNQGLRLKLHFMSSAQVYKSFPWEMIRVSGRSVVLDPHQTIVRTIDVLEPAIPLALDKTPYRILVIASTPVDVPTLAYSEVEVEQIAEALDPFIENGLIEMEVHHERITFARVESFLRQGNFHIFHFTGHGRKLQESHGTSKGLVFSDDKGKAQIIDGHRLGVALLNTGVRMAFLNTNTGVDLAEALLQVGLPIVIGNLFPVSDQPSASFGSTFYTELAKTSSVEQAVLAGRWAMISDFSQTDWVSPILLTRAIEENFWAGEAGYKIETFIRDGRLVTEAKQKGDFNASVFANRLQVVVEELDHITVPDARLKAQQLVAEVRDAIANSEIDNASLKLSEASTFTLLTISEQTHQEKVQTSERRARWTVLSLSVGLLLIVVVLGYMLRDVWTPTMSIPVIALPISVIVWSFIGGVAAMLQAFVGTKRDQTKKVNYEWLIWRPIVGVIMGSVVYLAISAGLAVLGQTDLTAANTRATFILWTLAFLGGFSDRFAILVFDNIVRTVSKSPIETPSDKVQKPNESSS